MNRGGWVVLTALLLGGCSAADSPPPSSDPPTRTGPAPIHPPLVPTTAPIDGDLLVPGETVVLTLVDGSTYWCPVTFAPVPLLVVYDNGTALRAENSGTHCDPVPLVWVGRVDVEAVRARLDDYFASPVAAVDLMVNIPIDGMTSTLTYRDRDGSTQRKKTPMRASSSLPGDPEQVRAGNAAFNQIWDELMAAVPTQNEYQVTEVVVGITPEIGYRQPSAGIPLSSWPLTGAPWNDLAGTRCVDVSGSDAAKVLTASGSTPSLQSWEVGGAQMVLTIELSLPGAKAGCAG